MTICCSDFIHLRNINFSEKHYIMKMPLFYPLHIWQSWGNQYLNYLLNATENAKDFHCKLNTQTHTGTHRITHRSICTFLTFFSEIVITVLNLFTLSQKAIFNLLFLIYYFGKNALVNMCMVCVRIDWSTLGFECVSLLIM